jgi:hypothetical protein
MMTSHSKIKRRKYDLKYIESEKGFFNCLWQAMNRVDDKGNKKVFNYITSKYHLLELWEKQKKDLGGPYCGYTGISLTTKRSNGEGWKKARPTNISVDRIDPRLHYEEGNIVFSSWEFNNRKSGVTPDDCKLILKVYEEKNANK